jgi:hypothetical protein
MSLEEMRKYIEETIIQPAIIECIERVGIPFPPGTPKIEWDVNNLPLPVIHSDFMFAAKELQMERICLQNQIPLSILMNQSKIGIEEDDCKPDVIVG